MQGQVSYALEKQQFGVELVDAHCHLELFEDYKVAVMDAQMAGIRYIITSGGGKKSNLSVLDIVESKDVFGVIGIDPEHSSEDSEFIKEIKGLIKSNKKLVGIGEIGLDYKLPNYNKDAQKNVFLSQIEIAKGLDIPIVIHSRKAIDDVINVVDEYKVKKAMFHFFEGDENQARQLADLGFLISIPPIESSRRKRVINALELNSIAVETDSPVVGKSPIDVIKTVNWIAEIKGLNFRDAASGITQNVKKLFSI